MTENNRFLIGEHTRFTVTTSGELYCFANDAPWFYWNNFGELEFDVIEIETL